jgi:FkbM family methyltransferase
MMKLGFLRRRDQRLDSRYFALNDLDRKLEQYIDFDGGFFIEAGGNDGISQSNTLHFERYRGWRGLLIEPIPELAWHCRLFRPGAVTVNAALGTIEQRGRRVAMTYCNLMSTVEGAMRSKEEERRHIDAGAAVQKVTPYRLTVPCRALTDILARYEIGRIDLLSVDVEGYEENVLRGIDFGRFRPRYMLIEARFRERVEKAVSPDYELAAELTERDLLFRARVDCNDAISWGWRYSADRGLGHALALARWYSN